MRGDMSLLSREDRTRLPMDEGDTEDAEGMEDRLEAEEGFTANRVLHSVRTRVRPSQGGM